MSHYTTASELAHLYHELENIYLEGFFVLLHHRPILHGVVDANTKLVLQAEIHQNLLSNFSLQQSF